VYVVSAEGKFPAVRMPKSRPGVPDSVFGSAFFVVATDNADVISWGLGDAPVDLAPLGPVVDLVPARS